MTAASSAAGSRSERWVEIISTAPAKLFGMYPAQGRDRGRLGRRHRHLRPERDAHDQRGDPPHGRRLLVLRGPPGPGPLGHRPEPRLGHRPRRRSSPAARATAGSSSARPPITPGSARTRGDGHGRSAGGTRARAAAADDRRSRPASTGSPPSGPSSGSQTAAVGADDETTADLVQAVDELVCNVVEHGYAGPARAGSRSRPSSPPDESRSGSATTPRPSTRPRSPSRGSTCRSPSAASGGWASTSPGR